MTASSTDLFKKLARKWVGQIGSGGVANDSATTIPLSSATNLPTDTSVVAVIDRVDVNGTATPTLEESVIGVVSSSNLVTCTRGVEGTAQAHSAGAVVEILVTNKGWNDIVDGILAGHSQLGAHTTDTISEKTSAAGVTIDGVLLKDSEVTTDTISEKTSAAGVTVDSCLIKDGNAAKATVMSTAAKANVYLSENQSLTGGAITDLALDTELFDVGSNFNVSTYKFTAPVTGYYYVSALVTFTVTAAGDDTLMWIETDGNVNNEVQVRISAPSTSPVTLAGSTIMALIAGEYIRVRVRNNTNNDSIISSDGQTFLAIHLLST